MKHHVVTILAAIVLLSGSLAYGQDQAQVNPARARELHRKVQSGQKLTAEEQAEYDRARQEFQGGRSKGRPAKERGRPAATTTPPSAAPPASPTKQTPTKQTPTFRPFVSKEACPTIQLSVPTKDGKRAIALMRKPPGKGSFPAIVYFHGGSATFTAEQLESQLQGQTLSRFLAAGYVVVAGTYRPVRQIDDAIIDGVAIVEHVKTIDGVDPQSVVIWGDSGGGSLAFDIAATIPISAITVHEPATILFARVGSGADRRASILDPQSVYTPEVQKRTRAKIQKINCPIFLPHGVTHTDRLQRRSGR
ncbi:MAG: alpha/beta hydrolase fold domain-containing protein [Planctomycetaceae bacterium]